MIRILNPVIIVLALAFGASVSTAASASSSDYVAGGIVFRQRCSTCHSIIAGQKSAIAPNLAGVVGRKAASVQFNYSAALKNSALTWTMSMLDRFLTSPGKTVPGTRMIVGITDPQQRANIIAFLSKQK